jgi:hypothetical protein
MRLSNAMGWVGAIALALAPYHMPGVRGYWLACVGLALLTAQATRLRAWNLVGLNLVSIVGYWSLI